MKASLVSATSLTVLLIFEMAPARAAGIFTLSGALNFGDALVNCPTCTPDTLNETASNSSTGTYTVNFGIAATPYSGGSNTAVSIASGTTGSSAYTFAPTVTGAAATQTLIVVAHGVSSQALTFSVSGTGVAPIETSTVSKNTLAGNGSSISPITSAGASVNLGYVLSNNPSTSASATVTVLNTGNGNLATNAPHSVSNLNGSVSTTGTGFSGANGSTFSLNDPNSGVSGATTSTTYTYSFAPTGANLTTVTSTVTLQFSDGSEDGKNNSASATYTLTGTAVAPVASVSGANAGYVLAGHSQSVLLTVQNTGNGNLSQTGTISNLHGSVGSSSGLFAGSGGSVNGATGIGDTSSTTFTYVFSPTADTFGAVTTNVTGGFSYGTGNAASLGTQTGTLTGTGVAPIASVSQTNPNYVLVNSAANSKAATVTVSDIGNGDLAGADSPTLQTNLHGSVGSSSSVFVGSGGSVNLQDSNATTAAGFGSNGATTATYTYNFAPTITGAASATVIATFTNSSGSTGVYATGTTAVTLTATGVAPTETVAVTNAAGSGGQANTGNLGYLLVGSQAATATITQSNVGNGNLAGTGGAFNLSGSITNVQGNGYSGGTTGSTISLQDSHAGTGSTTASFTYTFAPSVRGSATTVVTSSFSNGSTDGLNNAAQVQTTVTGTGVAPTATLSAGNNGYVLVTQSDTATVTVQNTGNGNLAGTGGAFNLNGSVSAATGSGFSGGTGSFSLQDANAGATTASYGYTFAPTVRGTASAVVTGTFSNGIGNSNTSGSEAATLTATGVAPIESVSTSAALARFNAYGGTNANTGTAVVTVQNAGNGNLAGTGGAYNLNGSVSNALGGTVFSNGSSAGFSLRDSTAQTGATTATYTYTFAPTARGVTGASVTVNFSNGNSAGTNLSQSVATNVSGTGVGPTYASTAYYTSNGHNAATGSGTAISTPQANSSTASASTIDFGNIKQNQSVTLLLNISNISTDFNGANVDLTDLSLLSFSAVTGGTDPTVFTISGGTSNVYNSSGVQVSNVLQEDGGEVYLPITVADGSDDGTLTGYFSITTDASAAFGSEGDVFTYELMAQVVDEPTTLAVLGMGLAGLVLIRRCTSRAPGATMATRS